MLCMSSTTLTLLTYLFKTILHLFLDGSLWKKTCTTTNLKKFMLDGWEVCLYMMIPNLLFSNTWRESPQVLGYCFVEVLLSPDLKSPAGHTIPCLTILCGPDHGCCSLIKRQYENTTWSQIQRFSQPLQHLLINQKFAWLTSDPLCSTIQCKVLNNSILHMIQNSACNSNKVWWPNCPHDCC